MIVPPTSVRAIALLVCALVLAGCASFSDINPGDSAQSVADRVGKPVSVWKNSDGSELWQYPQGYYAVQCFMITMGPDQRVQEVHQARGEPYFSMVQAGMVRDDVVWVWRYYDINYMFFNVLFDRTKGTVRNTQRLQEILFLDGNQSSR